MKKAQNRQKSYADKRRKDLEFAIGDFAFLKVASMKGVLRFGKKGKLSLWYIGPFEILDRVGDKAYCLLLPLSLSGVHDVFHVSMLRKCIGEPKQMLEIKPLNLNANLTYEERPTQILNRQVKRLRNKEIPLVKVLWENHSLEDTT